MKHAVLQKEGQGGLRSMCEQITVHLKILKKMGNLMVMIRIFKVYK